MPAKAAPTAKKEQGGAGGKKSGGGVKGQPKEQQSTVERHGLDDETNAGFGKYLRSQEGIEMMKLFVIANTIVVFMTMAWPQMQQSYQIIRSMFYGDEAAIDEQ
ncbi:uncharacterized protein LOC125954104 [Anopheles darlingi]|uniref:uncharacterized protein LOC125954104 n=1 Tax=Anopheles darlingi TaxID=43151 RepID=UPI0020FFFA79|nr:uncharacterized protein LOC125954104 [Anopheles darlingi]XP_049540084.1 uncharacterized protein LOC125954104 [Anopheles darlingi]